MTEVDNRVVAMQFDNESFERKLSATIASLDKLRSSLDFAASKRGLEELNTAGKNFSMDGMTHAIEGVSGKFLAMTTIAITALATITSHAVNAGLNIVKSFSISPIQEGFSDYNAKLTSVQTIMNATGENIQTVNGFFNELDTYADKTIYNLRDMTSAFAKFTNAGLEMKVSVPAIKGIANMVALAGQGADAAQIAMYNLSQSIAGGFLTTIDYKSLNLANVATKEWKDQMIAAGVAAGTLKKSADGTYQTLQDDKSFKGAYKDAQLFTEGLKDQWATTDILTKVLGDYGNAETEIGKKALAAAQDVKSLPMMIDTLKASVGTGWTQTFELLLGNVEESKQLFTSLTGSIQGFLDKFSNARNNLLQGWKDLGGRTVLIQGLKDALSGIASVLRPIGAAFREIFPPMTVERLVAMTNNFSAFAQKLKIGADTADKIKRVFRGLFALLEIGWTVIKELAVVIGELLGALIPAGGHLLTFGANGADMITKLNKALVEGGKIHDFFIRLREVIKAPIVFLQKLKDDIQKFFETSKVVEDSVGRIGSRVENLKETSTKIATAWENLMDRLQGVFKVLDSIWDYITDWFGSLGTKLAAAFHPGDFDAAVDIVNVGLLGGIALMLKKFLSGGIKLDLGKGLVDKITKALDGVTGTLKAMQTNLKAEALLKIAGALALLTVSIVALSLIDSAELTKALTAITIGFAQLVGVMTLMDKLVSSTGAAAKVGVLGVALIELSIAIGILAIAIRALSGLSWAELTKGLVGVGVGLAILVGSTQLMAADVGGMIRAGIAMIAIAIALRILANAVEAFSVMSWGDMAKGLVGVAVALGLVTLAMNFMPAASVLSGAGFIEIAVGLTILAGAVKLFSMFSWADMAKGLVGIAGALLIIAGAMQLMPLTLPITAAGILILSVALTVMAGALKLLGMMSWEDMAKGLIAFAGMLLILAVGVNAMSGAIAGAAALVVVAGAMLILTHVLRKLGEMEIEQILIGLGAMAATLLLLGAAAVLMTPIIPQLLGLGVALALVGAAFTLFGLGAILIAKALETLSVSGVAGIKALIEGAKLIITYIPEVFTAVVKSILNSAGELLGAVPLLVRLIGAVLSQLLETIVDLAPKIAKAILVVLTEFLKLVRELYPDVLATGFELLITFLKGIRDNIGEIVKTVVEIMIAWVSAMVMNMPMIVGAAVKLIVSFLGELANHGEELVAAGLNLLVSLLNGIANNIHLVTEAVAKLIIAFIASVAMMELQIVTAGFSILIALLRGIADNILRVVDAVTQIITTFIFAIGNSYQQIIDAGFQMLQNLLLGIANNIFEVVNLVALIIITFITEVGNRADDIVQAGTDTLIKFFSGMATNAIKITDTAREIIIAFAEALKNNAVRLADAAFTIITDFLNELAEIIRDRAPELRDAGWNLATAIADGMTGGLASKAGDVIGGAKDIAGNVIGSVGDAFGIGGPSRAFCEMGKTAMASLKAGLEKEDASDAAVVISDRIVANFHKTLAKIPETLQNMENFSPTITPVLDLTRVRDAAGNIERFMRVSPITPEVSIDTARQISKTTDLEKTTPEPAPSTTPSEVSFTQNNYSPEALSANDIYRSTKSQFAKAKEELGI